MRTRITVLALASGTLVLPGCLDRALAFETDGSVDTDTDTDTETNTTTEGDPPIDDDDDDQPECIDIVFNGGLPAMLTGTTFGELDDFAPSCADAGAGSGDIAVLFTAPSAGQYRFDTQGSTYDTVLEVVAGTCIGESLQCNDDASGGTSSVTVDLSAGQEVTIVIDGFGAEGDWTLNLQQLGESSCPDQDLGIAELPFTVEGSNSGALNSFGGTCAGDGGSEQTFVWTPPYAGTFAIDALQAAFDDVVYVLDGRCTGTELACNDDVGSSLGAGVLVSLQAGVPATIVVDSVDAGSGPFSLVFQDAPTNCDASAGEFFGAPVSVVGELPSGLNLAGTSCGGHFSDDYTITWTPEVSGAYQISVNADFEALLSVAQNCTELSCAAQGVIDIDVVAGEPLVVAVDGLTKAEGAFTLSIEESRCPQFDLPAEVPVSADGNITGAADNLQPGCVDGGSDHTYGWTVPLTGRYRISLAGSSYDTVLAVFDGSCNGPQLYCDDDGTGDLQSELVAELAGGQQVVIVVDGFGGNTGAYILQIDAI